MIGWPFLQAAWGVITGNPIARALAKVAGVVFAVLTMRALWKRDGRKEAEAKQAEAGLKAATKGRDAAREGKVEAAEKLKQGQKPEDIVRGNDAEWR